MGYAKKQVFYLEFVWSNQKTSEMPHHMNSEWAPTSPRVLLKQIFVFGGSEKDSSLNRVAKLTFCKVKLTPSVA